MSYTLGNITLPNPQELYRDFVEKSQSLSMLDGTTKKDITNRKEVFTLVFRRLTQSQVSSILTELNQDEARNFAVTENNLTVSSTPVLVSVNRRAYNKGGVYREDLTLILEEVK